MVEVWRHIIGRHDVRLLLPQVSHSVRSDYGRRIELQSVQFVPCTRRSRFRYLRRIKFALTSFWYDVYTVCTALSQPYDVIYFRTRYLSFAPLVLKFFGKKYVCEVNGLAKYGASKIKKSTIISLTLAAHMFLEKRALRGAMKIITVTEELIGQLQKEYSVDRLRCVVIPNGVDIDLFKPGQAKSSYEKNHVFRIGFVGHFAPWQGIQNVLPVIPAVNKQFPVKLLLVGDGMMLQEWKTTAERMLEPQQYEFLGMITYDQVPKYIQSFDFCIAPFTMERNTDIGLSPLKLYEYLACAKPVLVTDIPGVSEIVHVNNVGVVIPDSSQENMVRGISQMIERRDEWPAMGRRGRHLVERDYSWKVNSEKVVITLGNHLSIRSTH
ncbi:MAG: glycosyltransferase family 4 protein [Patescibacteria group bacterium]